jgi:hypothetical protein
MPNILQSYTSSIITAKKIIIKNNTRAIYVLLRNYLLDEKWSRRPHAKPTS